MIRGLSVVLAAGFSILAVLFARAQSIWVDEVTQLSGLGLPLGQQFSWLTGSANPIPGVPPDRMPPLSYWLGAAWAQVFGLTEMSMRMFGIVAMLCGAPAVYLAGRVIAGRAGSWLPVFALAAIYLSPGVIVQAGEIRAYPLYFAISAWAVWAYLQASSRPEAKWLVLLGLFSLAAGYTHFFGVVMAGLLWLSLLLMRLVRRQPAGPILIGGLATAASFAGLLPFISAAVSVSGAAPGGEELAGVVRDVVRMAFRLLLHGVHLSSGIIAGMAVLGTAGLAALALVRMLRREDWHGTALLLPMALAFAALPLLRLMIGSFDVLAPHYNLWLMPVFVLFISLALLSKRRVAAAICAGLLIAAHLAADARLIRYAGFYSHGSGEWVAEAIKDPAKTIVVHDGGGTWGFVYFPVHYLTGGQVTQILRNEGEADRLIAPGGTVAFNGDADAFPTRIFVRSRSLGSGELAARLQAPGDCGIPPMPADPGRTAETRSRCAFESATMTIVRD